MTDYFLASNEELARLQLQARVWEAHAETMLDRIGVQPGWVCLDLGCGAMGILGSLSDRVGPQGRVVGVDMDGKLLNAARAYVDQEGLRNVELIEADVHSTGLPPASFDLVHERFVFPHVPAPEQLLLDMIALTKPGGIVAVQEADHHSWHFHPESAKWSRLVQIIEAAFALRGDINIGRRTFAMLRRAGLDDVTIWAGVEALQDHHPYMRMIVIGANAMRQRIIDAGLSTATELDDLIADVEQRAADPDMYQITFTLTQVWGRRPLAR